MIIDESVCVSIEVSEPWRCNFTFSLAKCTLHVPSHGTRRSWNVDTWSTIGISVRCFHKWWETSKSRLSPETREGAKRWVNAVMTKVNWEGCGCDWDHTDWSARGRGKWVDSCVSQRQIWKKNKDVNKHLWPLMWLPACFSISLYDQTSFWVSSKIDQWVHVKLAHLHSSWDSHALANVRLRWSRRRRRSRTLNQVINDVWRLCLAHKSKANVCNHFKEAKKL